MMILAAVFGLIVLVLFCIIAPVLLTILFALAPIVVAFAAGTFFFGPLVGAILAVAVAAMWR